MPASPLQDKCTSTHADEGEDEASFIQHSLKAQRDSLPRKRAAVPKAQINSKAQTSNDSKAAGVTFNAKGAWLKIQSGVRLDDTWDQLDGFLAVVTMGVLILYDFFVTLRLQYNMRNHVLSLMFMILVSSIFCALVWIKRGQEDGIQWVSGYVLEWALSMDNLFAFHILFNALSVPKAHSVRTFTIGMYLNICFRIVMILSLSALLDLSYAVHIIIGGLLIIGGILSVLESDDDEEKLQKSYVLRFFKWVFGVRLSDTYTEDGSFFTRSQTGEFQVTPFFLVVLIIPVVYSMLSMDSTSTKVGQITSLYINVTSTVLALVSLRAFFFIIRDLTDYFQYLKYGVACILCTVGAEMIIQKWVPIELPYMLIIIGVFFIGALAASVIKVIVYGVDKKDCQSVLLPAKNAQLDGDLPWAPAATHLQNPQSKNAKNGV